MSEIQNTKLTSEQPADAPTGTIDKNDQETKKNENSFTFGKDNDNDTAAAVNQAPEDQK